MILGSLFLHRLWTLPQSIHEINHNPPSNSNHKPCCWLGWRRLSSRGGKPERSLFVVSAAAAKFKLIREFAKTPVKDFVLAYGAFCTAGLFSILYTTTSHPCSVIHSARLFSQGRPGKGGEAAFFRAPPSSTTRNVHLYWRRTKRRHPRKGIEGRRFQLLFD